MKIKERDDRPQKIISRKPIISALKHEVLKRDNYRCAECGAGKEIRILHIDHILPIAQGGTDELDNLQTLCAECNLGKSDRKWISKEKGNYETNYETIKRVLDIIEPNISHEPYDILYDSISWTIKELKDIPKQFLDIRKEFIKQLKQNR